MPPARRTPFAAGTACSSRRDGSGSLDLAAFEWSRDLVVLLNQGDGTLVETSRHPVTMHGGSIAGIDLDGQDGIDLVLGGSSIHYSQTCRGCDPARPAATTGLLAVRSGDDVNLSWRPAPEAGDSFDVSYVSAPAQLPACSGCPGSLPVAGCFPTGAGIRTCDHVGAVPGPAGGAHYYTVRAVCRGVKSPL